MNVAVIGTGRVGLVVGAGLADFGLNVSCVDSDGSKIAALQNGQLPFYEPGLRELVDKNRAAGRLQFTPDLNEAVERCLALFIAVGTEETAPGKPNLTPLFEVAKRIARLMREYRVLVIKSTVPVGTAARLLAELRETTRVPCDVVSNPEFLREGAAIDNFMRPDRIILGGNSEQALAIVRDIYRPLYLVETPILTTDHATAELLKYATNAFLATKITFINEMATLCDATGADVHAIAKGLGLDKRIGPKFLHPGPGFGGSCLPKDTRTLLETARQSDCRLHTVEGTLATNRTICSYLVGRLKEKLTTLDGRAICVLGLAYKPFTDDVRESPALDFIQALLAEGAQVRAHDPAAMSEAKKALGEGSVSFYPTPYAAAAGVDAVAVLTEWNEFRNLDLAELRRGMKGDVLLDARNIYEPERALALGFRYLGRGRAARSHQAKP